MDKSKKKIFKTKSDKSEALHLLVQVLLKEMVNEAKHFISGYLHGSKLSYDIDLVWCQKISQLQEYQSRSLR